jgi:hypothetical protein
MEQKNWFKRKQYGLGWYPSTWQGWVIILIFVGLSTAPAVFYPTAIKNHLILFLIYVLSLSAILVGICWKTGEYPKWQWGEKS